MRGNLTQTAYANCPMTMFSDTARVSSITIPATVMRNVFGASTGP